jgi:hypothetical protein
MFSKMSENMLFCWGPKMYNQTGGGNSFNTNGAFIFLVGLIIFFIKVLLVQISYNIVVPRLLSSYNVNMMRYRPLSFVEAIFLVILFNNLFSRF